ncbi:UDP-4-amino-4,6-dideoxy-N-acetyl-beta-L-altrosamine transaminase [Desulfobulbus alkaliphilus]|uniref:UDP-4-amino-4, 6-dideoxy-N-acetyl-beta-L-altrosamine transaminase n=1 Tax=Desulfobulbus alkaliphilus TaxID=869814 RepID=UPI003531D007
MTQSTTQGRAVAPIPYGRQSISEQDVSAVCSVLLSDFLTQGPKVPAFEQIVAEYCGARHAVAVNSATSALHIACLALGLGPGETLWTSPTTFVASANCALYCGASVDFVDIDPRTYNMSVNALEAKLVQARQSGCLPKVVVPVHLCGQPCEMQAIHTLSREYGFRIIEDASHAIGAKYQGEPLGNCRYSDITVFSFHPVKIITTGEGGMALTNDPELARLMECFRTHGITGNKAEMQPRPADEIWNYQQIRLGCNYRMTDIQAALGLSQMTRLDEFIEKRRQIAARYDTAFADLPVTTPWQHPDTCSSYHLYPIRIRQGDSPKSQRQVYDAFHSAEVNVNLHYIPVYRQPYYEAMGFAAGYCPEAEQYHKETISLPMYPSLSIEQQNSIIQTVMESIIP